MTDLESKISDYLDRVLTNEAWEESGAEVAKQVMRMIEASPVASSVASPLPDQTGEVVAKYTVDAAFRAAEEIVKQGNPETPADTVAALDQAGLLRHPRDLKGTWVETDAEVGAWYVGILDEPVHHTTEGAPVNIDWTRDGSMVGVEILDAGRKGVTE